MYDRCRLVLDSSLVGINNFIEETSKNFNIIGEHRYGNQNIVSGSLFGLKINCSSNFLTITGSLCKAQNGNNLQTLNINSTKDIIKKLSDALHVPLALAKVTAFEFGENFTMDYPIDVYLNHLGELSYYKRFQQQGSLYYSNGLKAAVFYDKEKQLIKSRESIPLDYKNLNLLRYEVRFNNHIARGFNQNTINALMLYNTDFYKMVLDQWLSTYQAIQKIHDYRLDFFHIKSKHDLYLAGLLFWSSHVGTNELLNQIRETQLTGHLTKKQAYDIKQCIKNANNYIANKNKCDYINELTKKIMSTYNNL